MERSTRTAFAYNLNLKADERDIYQLFAKVSGGHKGVRPLTPADPKAPRSCCPSFLSSQRWNLIVEGPQVRPTQGTCPQPRSMSCACTPVAGWGISMLPVHPVHMPPLLAALNTRT